MSLEKYEIQTSYDANGQIIVTVGNPDGDLIYGSPTYHHGPPSGTEPDADGDHITVIVQALNPPSNNGDLVFTGIGMYKDPTSSYCEVVSVVTIDGNGNEVERDRKRNSSSKVTSVG